MNEANRILIVENESITALHLEKTLQKLGYSVTDVVASGKDAINAVLNNIPDLILMDISLNGDIDGIKSAIEIHKNSNIPIIFTTAYHDEDLIERAKEAKPYGYIIKPFAEREIRTILPLALNRGKLELKLEKSLQKAKIILDGTIHAIAKMVEVRDPYTSGHQKRVGNLARAIAEKTGLQNEELEMIYVAGTIHDIGKISVPAEILSKPTNLLDSEFSIIKKHPYTGYEILKEIELPEIIPLIVYQHHERLDGSGYPQGLIENDIDPGARIVAVADIVEATSSHRPYRPALGISAALDEIKSNKGILYDKDAVEACEELFNNKEFDW